MSIKIEIKSPTVTEVSGISKAGKPYTIRKQVAYAYTYDQHGKPNDYPERIEMNLDKEQPPFQPGVYTVSPQSFFIGDFHQLEVGRLILAPLAASQPKAA